MSLRPAAAPFKTSMLISSRGSTSTWPSSDLWSQKNGKALQTAKTPAWLGSTGVFNKIKRQRKEKGPQASPPCPWSVRSAVWCDSCDSCATQTASQPQPQVSAPTASSREKGCYLFDTHIQRKTAHQSSGREALGCYVGLAKIIYTVYAR